MKDRIAASSRHTVRVQKARSTSRKMVVAKLPVARFACLAASTDRIKKAGR
jgi:hypothetical protein